MWPRKAPVLLALALALVAAACRSGSSDGRVKVVAAFYPLAWAAERVGGSSVDVEDLTPPGVDAHDTTLTAGQRADIVTADVVLILGDFGFQPDVERAAQDAHGTVIAVSRGMELMPSARQDLAFDPHVWLDPKLMGTIVAQVADGLVAVDPAGASGYREGESATADAVEGIDASYLTGLAGCDFTEFVTTHEAFGYLASEFGLTQIGIEGLTPESEPSAERIQAAADAIRSGTAAPAVFYEGTDEGKRVGEAVAGNIGVPALPLGTLESDPAPGNYPSVMNANLESLRKGLRCSG